MTSTRIALAILGLAACGGSKNSNTDAPGGGQHDAMVDTPIVPTTLTISGTATARSLGGSTPVSGATIGAYQSSNPSTAVATATTDASGNFSLTITTQGSALDGFIKASMSSYVDTYLYPPTPVTMDDTMVPVNMLTTSNYGTLYSFCGITQGASTGAVAVLLIDANKNPVAGATISSTPAVTKYCYNGANGFPSSSATSTAADGIGYMLNESPTGTIAVSGSKTGVTFKTHSVTAPAGALTTTEITE
jgi:hypothetical protein